MRPHHLTDWARGMPLRHLYVAAILVLAVWASALGIDYGSHWDEHHQFTYVDATLAEGRFLQGGYHYPGMTYWVTLGSTLPEFLQEIGHTWEDPRVPRRPSTVLRASFDNVRGRLFNQGVSTESEMFPRRNYKLRVRFVYLLASSLSILWVYGLVWAWRKSQAEALLAAAFLGLSWEVNYQSRWIAPDALMMQFGVLAMLFLRLAYNEEEGGTLWLRLAAVAAGLTCASKYPGGLMIVPVLLATYQLQRGGGGGRTVARLLEMSVLFALTFVLVTPGLLLEPVAFFDGVEFDIKHYGWQGHGGYTVSPGVTHLWKIIEYLALVAFSRFHALALLVFVLGLVGLYRVLRSERKFALTVLSFPALYLLYFSTQKVLIVRNLMILLPFLAILAARGVFALEGSLRQRVGTKRLLVLLPLGIAALLSLLNAVGLVESGLSVKNSPGKSGYVSQVSDYLSRHPETQYIVSEYLARDLAIVQDGALPPNVSVARYDPGRRINLIGSDMAARSENVVFYSSEGFNYNNKKWPVNRIGLYTVWGPEDVNFDYYASWNSGRDRVVMMPLDIAAREFGLFQIEPSR